MTVRAASRCMDGLPVYTLTVTQCRLCASVDRRPARPVDPSGINAHLRPELVAILDAWALMHSALEGHSRVKTAAERKALVRRRCLVCDWEGEIVEPVGTDEIGPPCQECQAPSERIAVVRNLDQEDAAKNPSAVALGRLGGLKGGKARAAVLGVRRRREIARQAALARWKRAKRHA